VSWRGTDLWRDVTEIPAALRATLDARQGFPAAADLLRGADRVIATGNGAAYYIAHALWLATLDGVGGPPLESVPAGLVAGGRFPWREGDRLLAISSSGEFRDVIEAAERGAPPVVAITAKPESTVARAADAVAVQTVLSQRAVTHTQAFCGGVLTALSIWAEVAGDDGLAAALEGAPDAVDRAIAAAAELVDDLDDLAVPPVAVTFGSGPAWAAGLEASLFLKEVAGIPTEGCETREGATTAMFATAPGHLVLSLATPGDPLLDEAERLCAARGARVIRLPGGELADRRLSPILTMPAIAAISIRLALAAGRNPDKPDWVEAYYTTARRSP
jgi:fructoselysine-6-P-deglycase FrlB-like protein